jgi:hypothetical protein
MSSINNQSEKNVLNLETLNAQYNNLLIQYRQAVADYIAYLNNSGTKNVFTNIKGKAFWGTGQAGTQAGYSNISDVNGCAALCSKTPNCTGATFNPTSYSKPMCQLRKGPGRPVISSPSDYAIIPQEKEILFNIQYINNKLKSVNNQILHIINNNISSYDSQTVERAQKNEILLANYEKLNQERMKINNMVREYEDLDSTQNEGELLAYSNYYSFLFLLILAIFAILLFYKFGGYTPSLDNTNTTNGSSFGEKMFTIIFVVIFFFFIYYAFIRNKI